MCIIRTTEKDVRLRTYFGCLLSLPHTLMLVYSHSHSHSFPLTHTCARQNTQAHIRPRSFVIAKKLIAYFTSCIYQMIWNLCKAAWRTRPESQWDRDENNAKKGNDWHTQERKRDIVWVLGNLQSFPQINYTNIIIHHLEWTAKNFVYNFPAKGSAQWAKFIRSQHVVNKGNNANKVFVSI